MVAKILEDMLNISQSFYRALDLDFYVNDFLGGAASVLEALKLRDDLILSFS